MSFAERRWYPNGRSDARSLVHGWIIVLRRLKDLHEHCLTLHERRRVDVVDTGWTPCKPMPCSRNIKGCLHLTLSKHHHHSLTQILDPTFTTSSITSNISQHEGFRYRHRLCSGHCCLRPARQHPKVCCKSTPYTSRDIKLIPISWPASSVPLVATDARISLTSLATVPRAPSSSARSSPAVRRPALRRTRRLPSRPSRRPARPPAYPS
jgi:hypothetical protein